MTSSCSTEYVSSLSAVQDPSCNAAPESTATMPDDAANVCYEVPPPPPPRGMWNFVLYDATKNHESRQVIIQNTLKDKSFPGGLEVEPFVMLLNGPIGSGKSHTARDIEERINSGVYNCQGVCWRISFATSLKIEYSLEQTAGDETAAFEFYHRMASDLEFKQTHRRGLIELAAKRRAVDPDYFVKTALVEIISRLWRLHYQTRDLGSSNQQKMRALIVIDDWRYYNELEVLARSGWFDPKHIMHVRLRCSDDVLRARVPGWTEELRHIPSETALFGCHSDPDATRVQDVLLLSAVTFRTVEERSEQGMRGQQKGIVNAVVRYFTGAPGFECFITRDESWTQSTKKLWSEVVCTPKEKSAPRSLFFQRNEISIYTRWESPDTYKSKAGAQGESHPEVEAGSASTDALAPTDAPEKKEPARHYGGFGCEVDAWGEAYPAEE